MAEADTGSDERCKALTGDGERCSRSAQEDGFCHQHDERDQTVSETESAQTEDAQGGDQEQEQEQEQRAESEGETTDPGDVEIEEVDVEVDDDRIEGLMAVRETVQLTATDLVGYEFNSVSEITATEDGWRATVDVIERRAVPDTQDILGRYEIELDEDGVVEGYRRIDRYRRGDTHAFD
ncbi:gas vesicle protein GvpO, halophile-type [Natronobeatus ordinarius]|uniref:gas vesicle protein GvpO, halophile-type n=1 Tax=Natronobeatus ordinarius TaxID=2963433 RepID=UPI0020CC801D|nr:gas vesicle protein GvpO [Natronobeatus ordinarius]